jgi:hypothetical protein
VIIVVRADNENEMSGTANDDHDNDGMYTVLTSIDEHLPDKTCVAMHFLLRYRLGPLISIP